MPIPKQSIRVSSVSYTHLDVYKRQVYYLFQNMWFYGAFYFSLVVLFTYFYTAVIFDPTKIAENLQKQGGYVPGIRPGTPTVEYLSGVLGLSLIHI